MAWPDYSYENFRRVVYNTEEGDIYFVPACPKCGRFVKADDSVLVNGLGELSTDPNATCKKCGRINMPCEGYI